MSCSLAHTSGASTSQQTSETSNSSVIRLLLTSFQFHIAFYNVAASVPSLSMSQRFYPQSLLVFTNVVSVYRNLMIFYQTAY